MKQKKSWDLDWPNRFLRRSLRRLSRSSRLTSPYRRIIICWILPSSRMWARPTISLLKKFWNLNGTKDWKRIRNSLMTGCHVRLKGGLEIGDPSTSTEYEWAANGTSTTRLTMTMTTLLRRPCRAINSISSTQTCWTRARPRSTTWKPWRIQITAW